MIAFNDLGGYDQIKNDHFFFSLLLLLPCDRLLFGKIRTNATLIKLGREEREREREKKKRNVRS